MLRLSHNRAVALAWLFASLLVGSTQCGGQVSSNLPAGFKPELVLQTGHSGQVGGLAFSPNKQILASGGGDQITLWEVAIGRQLRTLSSGTSSASPLDGVTSRFAMAFSPDGMLLAQYSRGYVAIWDVQTGKVNRRIQVLNTPAIPYGGESTSLLPDDVLMARMEFSPDGSLLAVPGTTLTLWNVATGQQFRSFPLCMGFEFTGARQMLLLIFTLKGIRAAFTDIDTGRELRGVNITDRKTGAAEMSIVHSPEGHWLAITNLKDGSDLWDLTSGDKPRLLPQPDVPAKTLQRKVSPDGRFLVLNTLSGLTVMDFPNQRILHTLEHPGHADQPFAPGMALATEFSADGRLFASAEYNGRLSVWDTSSWTKVADLYNHANLSNYVAFESDGKYLVSGKTRWDLESGGGSALSSDRISSTQSSSLSLGFVSPSGKLVAECDLNEGTIRVRDLVTGRVIHTLPAQSNFLPRAAAISPNGQFLAATYGTNAGHPSQQTANTQSSDEQRKQMADRIRKLAKGKLSASELSSEILEQITPQPSAQDETTRQIAIWDLASEHQAQALPLAPERFAANLGTAQFTSDGKYLIYGALEGSIQVWDVQSWKEISRIALNGSPQQGLFGLGDPAAIQIRSIEASPDGRLVAAATEEEGMDLGQTTQVMQMPQGVQGRKGSRFALGLPGTGSHPRIAEMKGAAQAASPSAAPQITTTGPIEIFDMQTGQGVAHLPGHAGGATRLAFSADGKTLASGGENGEIKLWDVPGQKLIRTLSGDASPAIALAFNPDGSLLVSSTQQGAVNLWDLEDGQLLVSMVSLGDGSEWLQVTPDGLFDGSPAAWKEILWRFSGNTFDVASVEMFFNEYYYPGLLSDLMQGKRPHAPARLEDRDRRQPQLAIERLDTAPAGTEVSSRNLKLKINVAAAPAGARDVRLFRNGSLVKVWHGDVLLGRSSVDLKAEIPIVAGENRLYAYAFNRDNVKSADATLDVQGAESLRRKGEVYVLAVGINRYADADYNLKFAVDDARAFGEVLQRHETSLQQFDRVTVVPIYDGDATKANILTALADLAAKVQPEDVVLIFIASHGIASQGHFYLVPHDLGYSGSRTELDADALQAILSHSISDRDLEQAFEGLDAGRLLLVLDACNSGQALEAEEKRQGPMNSKGLAQLAYEKGMYVLTASQSYQAAQEASELGHGLLTYALVEEGLEKGAADFAPRDGQIVAREWLSYASRRVPEIQIDKLQQFRGMNRDFSFSEGAQGRSSQQPRLFYRRELEDSPWVIARR